VGSVSSSTLWLRPDAPAAAPGACGSCEPAGAGCRRGLGGVPCLAPTLQGAADQIDRVMNSLRAVVDPDGGGSLVDLHLVQGLRIEDGEAELTVTFPRGCGSAKALAEDAFQALRRLLPDTDIYVRHAA
jgi:metal-sulfur cluster biosynthetic enzyme